MPQKKVKKSQAEKEISATRTIKQARAWFKEHGVSQVEFAKRLGVSPQVVKEVLRTDPKRRNKGNHGMAFKVAIALGLRPLPEGQSPLDLAEVVAAKTNSSTRPAAASADQR